jgi:hypothetical protein
MAFQSCVGAYDVCLLIGSATWLSSGVSGGLKLHPITSQLTPLDLYIPLDE